MAWRNRGSCIWVCLEIANAKVGFPFGFPLKPTKKGLPQKRQTHYPQDFRLHSTVGAANNALAEAIEQADLKVPRAASKSRRRSHSSNGCAVLSRGYPLFSWGGGGVREKPKSQFGKGPLKQDTLKWHALVPRTHVIAGWVKWKEIAHGPLSHLLTPRKKKKKFVASESL